MDLVGSGAVLSSQIAPSHPTNLSLSPVDRDNSGTVLSTQIMTQHPQLSARSGTSSSRERSLMKFYKGEPLALGITQILTGILGIAFGNVLDLANYHNSIYISVKTQYWTGISYIVSGSLSVAAAMKPRMLIVNSMLGINILSAIVAGLAIMILSISLAFSSFYYSGTTVCSYVDAELDRPCWEFEVIPQNIEKGMMAIFLVFNILEFGISISCAAFACKAGVKETFSETVVVIYQCTAAPGNAVTPPVACKDVENP